jgi:hypothetical protein
MGDDRVGPSDGTRNPSDGIKGVWYGRGANGLAFYNGLCIIKYPAGLGSDLS